MVSLYRGEKKTLSKHMQIKAIIFDIYRVFYKPRLLLGGYYDEKMIALANDLKKKNIKILALSNSGGEFLPLKDCFDKIYFCSEIGFYKPDNRALGFILEKEGLKPEDCIYFDDSKVNLESGESLGIKSFLFVSVEETKKIIAKFLQL